MKKIALVLGVVGLMATVGLLVAFSCTSNISNDAPALIAYGKYLVENGKFAKFSDVSAVKDRDREGAIHHQWLSEVVSYISWAMFGPYGAWLVYFAIVSVVFWSIWKITSDLALWTRVLILGLTILTVQVRLLLRGDSISLALFALAFLLLTRIEKTKRWNYLFLFVPLQIIWINIHPFGVICAGMVLLYSLEKVGGAIFVRENEDGPRDPIPLPLLLAAPAVMLSCLATPYGYGTVSTVLLASDPQMREITSKIAEYKPFTDMPYGDQSYSMIALIGIALFSAIGYLKRPRLWVIVTAVGSTLLTLKYMRMVGFGAIALAVSIGLSLPDARLLIIERDKRISRALEMLSPLAAAFVSTSIAILLLYGLDGTLFQRNGQLLRVGAVKVNQWHPWKAVEFVNENRLPGNCLCNYDIGSFLLLELEGPSKVTIDTQFLYEYDYFWEHHEAMREKSAFLELVGKYDVGYAVLRHSSEDVALLMLHLYRDENWKLVYLDEVAAVFLKATADTRAFVKDHEIDLATVDPVELITEGEREHAISYSKLAKMFVTVGMWKEAKSLYMSALERDKGLFVAWNNLAIILLNEGNASGALACFVNSAEANPDSEMTYQNIERILQTERFNKNDPNVQKALDLLSRR